MEQILSIIYGNDLLSKIITTFLGLVVIFFLVGVIRKLITRYIDDDNARVILRKITSTVGTITASFFAFGVLSAHLAEFTVALGLVGAGIAFALQEIIGSIAGWIALSIQHFYKIGDRVELGGIKGDVIDITLLRTTVMEIGEWVDGDLYNGRIVRIANSYVFKEPVFNYSADFPFLWDEIIIPIKYGSDYALARSTIEQAIIEVTGNYIPQAEKTWNKVVRKYMVENASVKPLISLIANDNWMEFNGRYVVDYKMRRSTKDAIFSKIVDQIEASAGKVKLASTTFEMVDAPKISIHLEK